MPKYISSPVQYDNPVRQLFREDRPHHGGISYYTNQLGSCGLGSLSSFYSVGKFDNWQDEAEWIAGLYRALYVPGILIYCLTDAQLRMSHAGHQALLNIGSQEVAVFPNLTHGPNMQHLFKVNIRNAVGRYCNKYGEAYTEPPKDDSEMQPEQITGVGHQLQILPVRPRS